MGGNEKVFFALLYLGDVLVSFKHFRHWIGQGLKSPLELFQLFRHAWAWVNARHVCAKSLVPEEVALPFPSSF